MGYFNILILGIVEGVTEFLPISSTAHLEITQALLDIPTTEFLKSFIIAIQLGAILAVVYLYWDKIFSSTKYFLNICIAFIPTAIVGFVLYKVIKSFLLGNIPLAATMIFLGGGVILWCERYLSKSDKLDSNKSIDSLSVKELIILGLSQSLAVVPGVSRSGAVIVAGRFLGLSAPLITDFSFLLAIPTIFAATAYDLLKSGFVFSGEEWQSIAFGMAVSFVVAFVVARWLIGYVKEHSFKIFGWYRIVLGLAIFALISLHIL